MTRKFLAVLLMGMILLLFAGCRIQKGTKTDTNTSAEAFSASAVTESIDAESEKDESDIEESVVEYSDGESSQVFETESQAERTERSEASEPSEETSEFPLPTETSDRQQYSEPPKPSEQSSAESEEPVETTSSEPTHQEPVSGPDPEQSETSEPKPEAFTESDHRRIVAEVKAYAESYADEGFVFEWKDSMTFGADVGYMGTPRVKYEGVDGVIKTLKHHIDLVYKTSTDPKYGVTADYMTYKVEQVVVDGDLAYVVIYGG